MLIALNGPGGASSSAALILSCTHLSRLDRPLPGSSYGACQAYQSRSVTANSLLRGFKSFSGRAYPACAVTACSSAGSGSHPSCDQTTFPLAETSASQGWSCTPYPSAT